MIFSVHRTLMYVIQQEIWILMIQSRNIIGCNYLWYFLLSMLVNFFEYLTTHSKLIEKYLSIIQFVCHKAIRTYLLINVLDLTDGLFRDWSNIFKTTFVLNYDNTTFFVKLQMKKHNTRRTTIIVWICTSENDIT